MSDYLTEEEQVERIKKAWSDYGIPVVAAVVLGIAGLVGFRFYSTSALESSQAASDLYHDFLIARGLGDEAETLSTQLDTEHESSTYRAFALLHQAKDATDNSDWEGALSLLEQAVEITDGSPVADVVRLRIARVQMQLAQWDAALATLTEVKGNGHQVKVFELSGDIHFANGDLDAARLAYESALNTGADDFLLRPVRAKLSSLYVERK